MTSNRLRGKALKLIIVLVSVCALGGAGFLLHKYRKRAALEASLTKGLKAYDAKQYTQAAAELGRYLTGHRTNVDVLLKYADAQFQRGPRTKDAWQQAVRAWEQALRYDPSQAEAAERLTRLYFQTNAPVEAERVARSWLQADSKSPVAKRQLAIALLVQKKGNNEEALRLIQELVDAQPLDPYAARLFGELNASKGSAESRPATSTAPAGWEADAELLARSVQAFEGMVTRYPEGPAWRIELAKRCRLLSRYPAWEGQRTSEQLKGLVTEHLQRAEELPSVSVEQLSEIAILWTDMGMFDRAARTFDRLEQMQPANVELWATRLLAAVKVDDYAQGAAIADRAFKQSLGDRRADLLETAAECYARAGRVTDARKCIDELKAGSAESHVLVFLQAVADAAEASDTGSREETAKALIDALEDAVRRAPKYQRAQLALARACAENKQLDRAIKPYLEFARLQREASPLEMVSVGSPDLELVDMYAGLGRWDEAISLAEVTRLKAIGTWLWWRAWIKNLEVRAAAARPGGPQEDPKVLAAIDADLAQVVARAPVALDDPAFRLLSARVSAWLGKVDEAAASVRAWRDSSTDKVGPTRLLIDLLADAGRYDEAMAECAEAAKSDDPKTRTLFQQRQADLMLAKGTPDEAIAALEAAVGQAQGRERTQLRLRLAEVLLNQGRMQQACELLKQTAEDDRRSLEARLLLLRIPPDGENKLDRQQIIDQLKTIEGEKGRNWRYCQAALWLQSDAWKTHSSKLEPLLKECIVDYPDWFEPMDLLIVYYERAGSAAKAIEAAQELISRTSTDEETRVKLRLRLIGVASRAEKWTEVDAAINAMPARIDNPAIRRELEEHRLLQAARNGNPDQARSILEQRIAETPDDFRSRVLLVGMLLQSARDASTEARVDRLLDEASRAAPNSLEVLRARVTVLASRREFDKARAICDKALDSGQNPDAILLRSRVWEAAGDKQKALADLQAFAAMEGKAEDAFLKLGQFYYRHGQSQDALEAWREGLKRVPKSVDLRGALVEVLLAGGAEEQRKEAVVLIDSRLSENPQDNDFLLLRADYLSASNPQEAIRICEEVGQRSPGAAKAFARLAQLRLRGQEPDRATQAVDQGLAGSPRSAPLLMMKAGLLIDSKPDEAAAFARRAADVDPDNEAAHLMLADALNRTGATATAIQVLERFCARAKSGEGFDARLNLARLRIQTGRPDSAEPLLKELEAARPDHPGTATVRLALHAARQQWDALIQLADATIARQPEATAVGETAGDLLLNAPDAETRKKAIRFFEQIAAKYPDVPEVQARLGMALYQAGEFGRASEVLQGVVDKQPKNLPLLNNLVWIVCEELKDPTRAEKIASAAMAGGADYPNLWDTWGVVLYRLTRPEQAADAFRKAMDHPQATPDTKHSATFHLARTIAESDPKQSLQLLDDLLGISKPSLSESEKAEAEALQTSLKGKTQAVRPGS